MRTKRNGLRWYVGEPSSSAYLFSVIREDGLIIALHIPTHEIASQIALLPILRRLGEEATEYHIESGERLPKAYRDLFDVLSKLKEPE